MTARRDEILRWPLWSWRNFSVTSAAILLLLAGVGRVVDAVHPTHHRARVQSAAPVGPSPAETSSTSPSTTPPTGSAEPKAGPGADGPAPGVATDPAATHVAEAFVRGWARPGLDQRTWLHGIQPLCTKAFAHLLSTTDPARVPASAVTGEARLRTAGASAAVVWVPTDGGPVLVSLARGGGRWQVADVAPADQPPAAPTPALTPAAPGN